LIRETNRIVNDVAPTIPESEVYCEGKSNPETLKLVQRLDEYDGYFKKLANSEEGSEACRAYAGRISVVKKANIPYSLLCTTSHT